MQMKPHATLKWIILVLLLAGCGEEIPAVRLFKQGDIVEFVISGQKAQIIHVNHCAGWKQRKYPLAGACTYDVRMVAPSILTDTHLLSPDGPLHGRPLIRLEYVKEYELRKAQ